jgi:RNA polymerase sigma-70 factor (ECF subfamily)
MDKTTPYETMSAAQLVQLSLKAPDTFYYLITRYEPKLLRYITRITNIGPEESEDLLQEIFIKIYRNLNRFNRKLKFSSWVYRIARNEIINQYRKKKSYSTTIDSFAENDDVDHLAGLMGEALSIDNVYISKENAAKVEAALEKLPDKYREVLILRYFEDQSYKEISDILRKPAGTVATLINRAKSKFRKIAKQHQLEKLVL